MQTVQTSATSPGSSSTELPSCVRATSHKMHSRKADHIPWAFTEGSKNLLCQPFRCLTLHYGFLFRHSFTMAQSHTMGLKLCGFCHLVYCASTTTAQVKAELKPCVWSLTCCVIVTIAQHKTLIAAHLASWQSTPKCWEDQSTLNLGHL